MWLPLEQLQILGWHSLANKEVTHGTHQIHCPSCTECPEVEITEQGVSIGEDANIVRLSHAEWNELVRLVRSGKLREVLTVPGIGMGQ